MAGCPAVSETGELEKIDIQWADNRKVIDRVGGLLMRVVGPAGQSRTARPATTSPWTDTEARREAGRSSYAQVRHTTYSASRR
jgi:site-specific DNA recombinase